MAVAPEAMGAVESTEAGAAQGEAEATRPGGGQIFQLPSFSRSSGGGSRASGPDVGVRLIWAAAAGLLVLEVLSVATGRFWSWNLKGGLSSLANAGSYLGLYPGQQAKLATQAPPASAQNDTAQNALVATGVPAVSVSISGRAGGNSAGV